MSWLVFPWIKVRGMGLCVVRGFVISFRRKSSISGRRSKAQLLFTLRARIDIVPTPTLFAFFILLSISSSPLYLPISLFPSLHPSSSNISPHLPFRFYTSLPTSYIPPPFITPPSPSAPHLPPPNRISAPSHPTTPHPSITNARQRLKTPSPLSFATCDPQMQSRLQ